MTPEEATGETLGSGVHPAGGSSPWRRWFDASPLPTVIVSAPTLRIVEINPALCEWLGHERAMLVGQLATSIILDPQLRAQTDSEAASWAFADARFRHRDGSTHAATFHLRALSLPGASVGELLVSAIPAELSTSVHDLELSHAALDALDEPVALLRCVRQRTGAIVDFEFVRVNPAAANAFGRAGRDVSAGRRLLDVVPELRAGSRFDDYCAVVTSDVPLVHDLVEVPGLSATQSFTARVRRAGDGIVVILRDTTEHKRLTRELVERQHHYRLLADYAGDIVIHKRNGLIEWIAPSVTALLGWEPSQLVGSPTSVLVHPDDQHLLAQPGGTQAETHRRVRVRMQRQDGAWRWVEKHSRPLPDDDGTVTWASIVSTVWDIQAEVEALEALQQAEEARRTLERAMEQAARLEGLGVLAGGLAHDFNNLLVAILGNTSLVLEDVGPDSPVAPPLRDVLLAAQRSAELTRQMLAYAQQTPLALEPVDLSALIESSRSFLTSLAPSSVRLTFELTRPLPVVWADRSQLFQVIVNLVSNAVESLPGGVGAITIRTFSSVDTRATGIDADAGADARVCIQVADNGHGMDAKTVSQMFDPFFTTKFTGRGLGLAAVHGIITRMRGAIDVTSAVQVGTTIDISLPAHTEGTDGTGAGVTRGGDPSRPHDVEDQLADRRP